MTEKNMDRYRINLNGLVDASVKRCYGSEGIYFEIIGRYVVCDHIEHHPLFTADYEKDASAIADALTTLAKTLLYTDDDFAKTLAPGWIEPELLSEKE